MSANPESAPLHPCPICSEQKPHVHDEDGRIEAWTETWVHQRRGSEIDEERLAQALYDGHVQHVLHSYSYTNREIAREIIAAYEEAPAGDAGESHR